MQARFTTDQVNVVGRFNTFVRVSDEDEEIGLDLSQHGEVMQEMVTASPEPLLARTA